ncbi:MAG TPA: VRR-NUC domain-containing protein [Actinocrinis sp.]
MTATRRLTAAQQAAEQLTIDAAAASNGRRPAMSEDQLLAAVRQLAKLTGWMVYHTHDSRRSEPGWPDLVMLHPRRRRCLFVELKHEGKNPTAEQQTWLDALTACGFETGVWRPTDLDDEIPAVLRGYRRLGRSGMG